MKKMNSHGVHMYRYSISVEMLDLLYHLKEMAVNRVPMYHISLMRTVRMFDKYDAYLNADNPRALKIEVIKHVDDLFQFICTIYIEFVNDQQVLIRGCRYSGIRDLEYYMDSNGILKYIRR